MHSTHSRREHIHGLLLGVAIGDALGLSRTGLTRRTALHMFGRPPLRYSFVKGSGVYGDNTRLMLINAQALLTSRSDLRAFRRSFRNRLSWYLLSLPVGLRKPVLTASLLSWFMRFGVRSGVNSSDNSAATRAIFSALAMHGTGHQLEKWTKETTRLTNTHPIAIDGCHVLAVLADYGACKQPDDFDSQQALADAIDASTSPEISDKLRQLARFLSDQRSPRAVARSFGWNKEIGRDILPTTVMSAYCFLRYPHDFRRGVESAITLGGDSATLGAVVGGLVGGHVSQSEIPRELSKSLRGTPHGPDWLKTLAERFSRWPHGEHDLHGAPAEPSDPPMQLIRNVMILPVKLWHFAIRLLYRRR